MSPRVNPDPTDFDDASDALGELRFEFESSKVGMALGALYEALEAVSDARDRRVAHIRTCGFQRVPMTMEERAAERLLNHLPELAEFIEKLVADQHEVELEERKRWA